MAKKAKAKERPMKDTRKQLSSKRMSSTSMQNQKAQQLIKGHKKGKKKVGTKQ